MLIRSADLALYRTKDGGGGGFHIYEPQLHLQAEERRVLEMALRKALQNDAMHLQYQPGVDSESGGLTGLDRKGQGKGKSGSVRGAHGGRRRIQNKREQKNRQTKRS